MDRTSLLGLLRDLQAQVAKIGEEERVLITARRDLTPPAAPANPTATATSSTTILVAWTAVSDATGISEYRIERGTDGVTFTQIAAQATTSYTDTGRTPGTRYYYRILAVDGDGNVGRSYSAICSAITVGGWSTIPAQSLTVGTPFSLSLATYAPAGTVAYAAVNDTLPTGLTLNISTGLISGTPTTVEVHAPSFTADDGVSTALADWNARSTGPGVIWAHRFSSSTDGSLYWAQKSNNPGGGSRFGYRAGDGVIGDGCLELFVPGGQGIAVQGGWARPIGPVRASAAQGTRLAYPADINNPGLDVMPFDAAYSVVTGDPAAKLGNACGGFITHPQYLANNQRTYSLGGQTHNEIVYGGVDGVYIQYRVKFPTVGGFNRLDYTDLWGKLAMFSNMSPNNANNEIVTNVMPNLGNRFFMYSATGSNLLDSPQGSNANGAHAQPGGAYDATCVWSGGSVNAAGCWTWPKDEWVTVLMQVVPGRHNPGSNYIADGVYRETAIRVWVARAGATAYTKIWDKSDYAFSYDNGSSPTVYASAPNPLAGLQQAYGFNSFRFEAYANPNSALPVAYNKDFLVLHDQVICSTQPIACPAV